MLDWLYRRFGRSDAGPSWVEPDDLRRRLRGGQVHLIIDVRGPDEFDGPLGHIPGALNVPLPAFAGRCAQFAAAGLPIVVVCLTDKRSSQAAAELAAAGGRNVAVLRGGMKAWRGE
jgi:rhodanese-related sulfurtransferase